MSESLLLAAFPAEVDSDWVDAPEPGSAWVDAPEAEAVRAAGAGAADWATSEEEGVVWRDGNVGSDGGAGGTLAVLGLLCWVGVLADEEREAVVLPEPGELGFLLVPEGLGREAIPPGGIRPGRLGESAIGGGAELEGLMLRVGRCLSSGVSVPGGGNVTGGGGVSFGEAAIEGGNTGVGKGEIGVVGASGT